MECCHPARDLAPIPPNPGELLHYGARIVDIPDKIAQGLPSSPLGPGPNLYDHPRGRLGMGTLSIRGGKCSEPMLPTLCREGMGRNHPDLTTGGRRRGMRHTRGLFLLCSRLHPPGFSSATVWRTLELTLPRCEGDIDALGKCLDRHPGLAAQRVQGSPLCPHPRRPHSTGQASRALCCITPRTGQADKLALPSLLPSRDPPRMATGHYPHIGESIRLLLEAPPSPTLLALNVLAALCRPRRTRMLSLTRSGPCGRRRG
jgi:hypothetical protein